MMRDYEAVLLAKNQEIVELQHALGQSTATQEQLRRDLARVSRLVNDADNEKERIAEMLETLSKEKGTMVKVVAKKDFMIKELKE